MRTWTRRYTMVVGVALILLTNLIALLGATLNRQGIPESVLQLSERELQVPYRWRQDNDNSGITLRLLWRAADSFYSYGDTDPGWLDKAKMASLGFNVALSMETDAGMRTYRKQLARPVFLALEFDGPAYRRAIELAKKRENAEASKEKDGEDNRQPTALSRELTLASRLFVVDAGLDSAALRVKYPDVHHYSIVRGLIQPQVVSNKETPPRMTGFLKEVTAENINVPFAFRDVFVAAQQKHQGAEINTSPPFVATVAFGTRLEPWIVAASAK